MARCPAHKDNSPSLSVAEKGDKILIFCHAGCDRDSILSALGIEISDLFLTERLPSDRKPTIVATYDYCDTAGDLKYQSVRMEPGKDGAKKSFFQRQPDGKGGWINNLNGLKGRWPFRLPQLIAADLEETIWIVEGEKDVLRLVKEGLVATTSAGGAGKWPNHHGFALFFRNRKVVIIADNDKPNPKRKNKRAGLEHAVDVARKLVDYVESIKLLTEAELLGLPEDGGDISDWLARGHTIDELLRVGKNAPEWIDRTPGKGGNGDTPTDDELRDRWLKASPRMIYARSDFYRYDKGVWKPIGEFLVKKEITAVIEAAKIEGISPSSGLLHSVYELSRAACAVSDDLLDANPDYLVLANGSLHIPTMALEGHSPELYMTSGIDYEYKAEAEAPTFDAYCYWLEGRLGKATVEFIQEFGGLSATIDTSHEVAVWLQGEPGCGKSTLIEAFKAALPNLWVKIGLRSIEQSRFSLARIVGKRLGIATEQPSEYIRCVDILDDIISGEAVTVEGKFRDAYDLEPTLHLLWAMNTFPRVADPGSGLFRRIKIIRFGQSLPEDEIDPMLKQKIKGEGQGILNWMLIGLKRLRERGYFLVPDEIKAAVKEFHESNDIVNAFFEECCDLEPNLEVRGGHLYYAYKRWCYRNGHKPMSNNRIKDDYIRLGLYKKKASGSGTPYWVGIDLKQEFQVSDSEYQQSFDSAWKKD